MAIEKLADQIAAANAIPLQEKPHKPLEFT
jgi:hypothetical protein